MICASGLLIVLAVASGVECVRNTPRSARASRNEASLEFECPEEFGYYPHPRDCTQYYVCVFGGALLESCTGGLMYSHELQTCDWPRNVGCHHAGIAKETEEDDPLLERAAKAESIRLEQEEEEERQQQQQQQQHHHHHSRQRQQIQRQQQATVTPASQPIAQITERVSRNRQPQHHQRTYADDEYEPATEIESDRQQRVYRGQPSTIGQVQRDRDGLRRNIISVSHPPSSPAPSSALSMSTSSSSTSSSTSSSSSSSSSSSIDVSVTPRPEFSPSNNILGQASSRRERIDKRIEASSILEAIRRQHDYPTGKRFSQSQEFLNPDEPVTVSLTSTLPTTFYQQRMKPETPEATQSSLTPGRQNSAPLAASPSSQQRIPLGFALADDADRNGRFIGTTSSRSILQQPLRARPENVPSTVSSVVNKWQRTSDEFEKNEISVTTPLALRQASSTQADEDFVEEESSEEELPIGPTVASRDINPQQRSRVDGFLSSSSASWLRSTEELEKNEISVSPGPAGRGFMIKRLRSDRQDFTSDDREVVADVTPAYSNESSTSPGENAAQNDRDESRDFEVSIDPPLTRQRPRHNIVPSPFKLRYPDKIPSLPTTTINTPTTTFINDEPSSLVNSSISRKSSFADLEYRKYYAVSVPQRFDDDSRNNNGPDDKKYRDASSRSTDYMKAHKIPVNPVPLTSTSGKLEEKKYYIPYIQHQQQNQLRSAAHQSNSGRQKLPGQLAQQRSVSELPDRKELPVKIPEISKAESKISVKASIPREEKKTDLPQASPEPETDRNNRTATNVPEDPAKNEISLGLGSSGSQTDRLPAPSTSSSGSDVTSNETEAGNEIPNSNGPTTGPRGRHRNLVRGQSRHKTLDQAIRRSSRPEREKDSVVNSRAQTESHYRTISSEPPRIAKTTASTAPSISKSYYSDPDQSYPYYTIYDDDVSIYKDDDYAQYTVNRTVQLQPQPPHQQNVRIAEVTPNANQYSPKPKKVPVNDADKYSVSPADVTVSDYDIYDNQPLKTKFRISDGHQSLRTNGLSHPVIHVTTPNAIVDTYVPLTSTTQLPPTTTVRPYTVTVQNRGRPQVNRGTAPPRLRPTLKPSTSIVSKAQEYVDIYRHPPTRPGPIYPTPTPDKPAAKCRKDVCLLPDCSCGGSDIPGDYLPEEIPQIVLLTFDDSVNDLNKGLYADLFEKGRKNPNGCPISATFYVSHEWTDYSQVQNLYSTGHEIASHTVSHSFGEQFSARKWSREVAGQREILAAYGGVKLEDVRGMRAPFLSVGGNNMFKMLWDTNFTYDSSMPIYENRPPSWPYTLDYKLFHDCMIPPCPTRSYPGLWEVPMVMWQDLNGGRCSMGDACSNPPTPDGVYKMLIKNFERHYTTNRAPFGLFYHAAWFTQPHHKEGFISFLDTIVAMDDVWVITNWQALQWVRNPTPLEVLDRFEPFGCNYPDRPKKCNNAKVCNLWHKSGVRYMKTCQPCPDIYPWTGKTGIRSSRIDNEVEN